MEGPVRRLTDGPLRATLEPLDGAFETRLVLFFLGFPRLATRHDEQRNHEIVVIRNDAHLAKGHIARLPGESGPGRYRDALALLDTARRTGHQRPFGNRDGLSPEPEESTSLQGPTVPQDENASPIHRLIPKPYLQVMCIDRLPTADPQCTREDG